MSDTALGNKAELRAHLRERLGRISASDRTHLSQRTCSLMQKQPIWQSARRILFFSPLPSEPDIWPLVEAAFAGGREVLFPKFQADSNVYVPAQVKDPSVDFRSGKFGIREPAEHCSAYPLNHLDLILVPGLGFDPLGGRLGRGRGFYDRLLVKVSGKKCGVAFDEQLVARVPQEPHDARVDCVLTPTRWIDVP